MRKYETLCLIPSRNIGGKKRHSNIILNLWFINTVISTQQTIHITKNIVVISLRKTFIGWTVDKEKDWKLSYSRVFISVRELFSIHRGNGIFWKLIKFSRQITVHIGSNISTFSNYSISTFLHGNFDFDLIRRDKSWVQ